MTNKHKVFISYYHAEDQYYKNYLLDMNEQFDVFVDHSVREHDIEDEGLSAENIRRIIRDNYIKDATVLILLCGKNTKGRKHVDWELNAAMYDSELNPRMGILVVNLPSSGNACRAHSDDEKKLISPDSRWVNLDLREEHESYHPGMPSRLIDNFVKGVPISAVDWNSIKDNPEVLIELIDYAYKRRKGNEYDTSALLRRNNSSPLL